MNMRLEDDYKKKIKFIALSAFIVFLIYKIVIDPKGTFEDVKALIAWILNIFSPLIYGFVIAYICSPISQMFEKIFGKLKIKRKVQTEKSKETWISINRGVSVFFTFITILVVLTLLVYSVYVMIGGSIKGFSFQTAFEDIKITVEQYFETISSFDENLKKVGISTDYVEQINSILEEGASVIQNWIKSIFSIVPDIGKVIINLSFGIIFAVSFITKREYFKGVYEKFLSLFMREDTKNNFLSVGSEINKVFHNFFRVQLLDLTLISIFTSIALIIVGCDFGLLVGIFAGYTNIIPYIGSWAGALPGFIVGLAEGGFSRGVFIYFYILIIQQIYYFTVSPKIQGSKAGIHPVFILLSLSVFGSIFGIVGMILAIPLAGTVKIFITKWEKRRNEKKVIEINKG